MAPSNKSSADMFLRNLRFVVVREVGRTEKKSMGEVSK